MNLHPLTSAVYFRHVGVLNSVGRAARLPAAASGDGAPMVEAISAWGNSLNVAMRELRRAGAICAWGTTFITMNVRPGRKDDDPVVGFYVREYSIFYRASGCEVLPVVEPDGMAPDWVVESSVLLGWLGTQLQGHIFDIECETEWRNYE